MSERGKLAEPCPQHPECDCDYRSILETVYGLLWHVRVDRRFHDGVAVYEARKRALSLIDKEGQARGITAARKIIKDGRMT